MRNENAKILEVFMKRAIVFTILVSVYISGVFAQNNVTNNNTITINGNVYYFRPSTTPSSPLPNTPTTNFIGEGHWYGEDAAKAWASISDWALEHCLEADRAVKPSNGQVIYIHQVHAVPRRSGLYNSDPGLAAIDSNNGNAKLGVVKIYYWVVGRNEQMEDGHRETRTFYF
jgi:hypothetical protein